MAAKKRPFKYSKETRLNFNQYEVVTLNIQRRIEYDARRLDTGHEGIQKWTDNRINI